MRKDKDEAFKLRKDGMSYGAIRERLKISKGTLSGWFSDQDWSKQIQRRLNETNLIESRTRVVSLSKIRGAALANIYKEAEEEAVSEYEHLRYNPLFIAGMMLYWGEGDKVTNRLTRVANSEAVLIRVHVAFMRKIFRFEPSELRASLLLYPDLDEVKCMDYWRSNGGLADVPFTKTQFIKGKSVTKKLKYGVCYVNYSSSFFKKKMLTWMKLLTDDLVAEDKKRP